MAPRCLEPEPDVSASLLCDDGDRIDDGDRKDDIDAGDCSDTVLLRSLSRADSGSTADRSLPQSTLYGYGYRL